MTKQTYKSAQGKTVDLGTIKLRNEHVRAVGNMNVNARGDAIDSNNQVVESKSQQIQRQNAQLTNVVDTPVHTSSAAAKRARSATSTVDQTLPVVDTETMDATPPAVDTSAVDDSVTNDTTPDTNIPNSGGGLAAAIARSKIIKQEKEKTARQLAQENPGVRKI
jgi:hypothetical protein